MIFEKGNKIVMIGDSVTDCERARPCGEGLFEAIGKSYVGIVNGLLANMYPERMLRVVNMGASGNTVKDLKGRWQQDVIDLQPDWVSVMIGINDVWRQYDSPLMKEVHVYLEEYAATLDALVAETLPKVKGMILMTPYYMEPNKNDAMRSTMDRYGAAVKSIAAKRGTLFVDTQAAFDAMLQHVHPNAIAWDRVHPNLNGHVLLAKTFLNAVGFEWL